MVVKRAGTLGIRMRREGERSTIGWTSCRCFQVIYYYFQESVLHICIRKKKKKAKNRNLKREKQKN